ncbi:hypothetical protein WG66_012877 [Moniliophthora roreri]|nr:hypothetical protein WG66_012877 [Moniliophthora roreri]
MVVKERKKDAETDPSPCQAFVDDDDPVFIELNAIERHCPLSSYCNRIYHSDTVHEVVIETTENNFGLASSTPQQATLTLNLRTKFHLDAQLSMFFPYEGPSTKRPQSSTRFIHFRQLLTFSPLKVRPTREGPHKPSTSLSSSISQSSSREDCTMEAQYSCLRLRVEAYTIAKLEYVAGVGESGNTGVWFFGLVLCSSNACFKVGHKWHQLVPSGSNQGQPASMCRQNSGLMENHAAIQLGMSSIKLGRPSSSAPAKLPYLSSRRASAVTFDSQSESLLGEKASQYLIVAV